jgi:hypothetical protein
VIRNCFTSQGVTNFDFQEPVCEKYLLDFTISHHGEVFVNPAMYETSLILSTDARFVPVPWSGSSSLDPDFVDPERDDDRELLREQHDEASDLAGCCRFSNVSLGTLAMNGVPSAIVAGSDDQILMSLIHSNAFRLQ